MTNRYKFSYKSFVQGHDGNIYNSLAEYEKAVKLAAINEIFKIKSYGDDRIKPIDFISLLFSKWEQVADIMETECIFEEQKEKN